METNQPSEIPKEEWERHRETIRQLYLEQRMTLRLVMQHMAQYPLLVHASENMYKKRIRRWGFDVKNHKLSTIQAAVSERQLCLNRGEEFGVFETNARKPVSESEINRYLRRKGRKIVHGEVVARCPMRAAARIVVQPPSSITRKDASTRLGPHQSVEETANEQQLLVFQNIQNTQAVEAAVRTSTGRPCQCQRCRHKVLHRLLNRWQYVRLADLVAPDMHRDVETYFSAYDFCLRSSWSAQLWSVNEDGGFVVRQPQDAVFDCFDFDSLFETANELWQVSNAHRARKVFNNALQALRNNLVFCMPTAIYIFTLAVIRLLDRGKTGYVSWMIKCSSVMVKQIGDATPALRKVFSALSAVDPGALTHAILQGWEVYSNCMESLDERLYLQAIRARSERIYELPSLDWSCTANRLHWLLIEIRQRGKSDLRAEVMCMNLLARAHFNCGQDQKAKYLAEEILCLADPYDEIFLQEVAPDTLRLLAVIHWESRKTEDAIEALKLAIDLEKRWHFGNMIIQDLETLAEWHRDLGNDQEALVCDEDVEEIINGVATLDLQHESGDLIECGSETYDDGPCDAHTINDCPCEGPDDECGIDAETSETTKKKVSSCMFREELTQTQQAELSLPVLVSDDDAEVLWC